MTKKEASIILDKKRKLGWMTNSTLLDLWKEDEEINLSLSEDTENILWYKPREPEPIIIYTGLKGMKQLEEMWEDFRKTYKLKEDGL